MGDGLSSIPDSLRVPPICTHHEWNEGQSRGVKKFNCVYDIYHCFQHILQRILYQDVDLHVRNRGCHARDRDRVRWT